MKKAALLIEDNDTMLVVRTALECCGYACDVHGSMASLLGVTRREGLGVVVVDASAPTVDCGAWMAWRSDGLGAAAAVMALGPDDGPSRVRHIDLGVDDFLAKPIRGGEFVARLTAALRRRQPGDAGVGPSVGGCSVDRASSAIVSAGNRVALTARELAVAELLFENAGQIVSRARLARDVWGRETAQTARTIEQHIHLLRRKLVRCVGEGVVLRGVYGRGYRLEPGRRAPPAPAPEAPCASRPPRPCERAPDLPRKGVGKARTPSLHRRFMTPRLAGHGPGR